MLGLAPFELNRNVNVNSNVKRFHSTRVRAAHLRTVPPLRAGHDSWQLRSGILPKVIKAAYGQREPRHSWPRTNAGRATTSTTIKPHAPFQ